MFHHTLMESTVRGTSRWAVALSTVLQCALLGAVLLIPLVNYYDLPTTAFVTFLTAPPPPPPPPPASSPTQVVKAVPRQFEAGTLKQPVAIPDKVAVIEESAAPLAGISGVKGGVPSGVLNGVIGTIISPTPSTAPLPPPPPVQKKPVPKRIRVGGQVAKARLTRQVRPQYPSLARQARIQGTVKLAAVISKDGSIQKLQVLTGHPLLVPAALSAVKQWRYKPTLLNGEAVEVLTNIDVNFSLSG